MCSFTEYEYCMISHGRLYTEGCIIIPTPVEGTTSNTRAILHNRSDEYRHRLRCSLRGWRQDARCRQSVLRNSKSTPDSIAVVSASGSEAVTPVRSGGEQRCSSRRHRCRQPPIRRGLTRSAAIVTGGGTPSGSGSYSDLAGVQSFASKWFLILMPSSSVPPATLQKADGILAVWL